MKINLNEEEINNLLNAVTFYEISKQFDSIYYKKMMEKFFDDSKIIKIAKSHLLEDEKEIEPYTKLRKKLFSHLKVDENEH